MASPAPPLLLFDFDGVLVDGMAEYWWAACTAARRLLDLPAAPVDAAAVVPEAFRRLRPLIHKGWEMVLAAAELSREDLDLDAYLSHYDDHCQRALAAWKSTPAELQQALEAVRHNAIAAHRAEWLSRHRFYPGVPERLRRLGAEGAAWGVLTTKGRDFAATLLASQSLVPLMLFGHEQGSKPEVLGRVMSEQSRPLWFIEDRRPTLETVLATPGLESVRCFLVSWGYLGAGDSQRLPERIHWLEPERFAAPLASWP